MRSRLSGAELWMRRGREFWGSDVLRSWSSGQDNILHHRDCRMITDICRQLHRYTAAVQVCREPDLEALPPDRMDPSLLLTIHTVCAHVLVFASLLSGSPPIWSLQHDHKSLIRLRSPRCVGATNVGVGEGSFIASK